MTKKYGQKYDQKWLKIWPKTAKKCGHKYGQKSRIQCKKFYSPGRVSLSFSVGSSCSFSLITFSKTRLSFFVRTYKFSGQYFASKKLHKLWYLDDFIFVRLIRHGKNHLRTFRIFKTWRFWLVVFVWFAFLRLKNMKSKNKNFKNFMKP